MIVLQKTSPKNARKTPYLRGSSAIFPARHASASTYQTTPPKTITYEYDGQKRRIAKYVNGQLTQGFLYQDQLRPIAEYRYYGNNSGATLTNIDQAATQTLYAQFIYASKINVPDIMLKGAGTTQEQTYKLVHDHLGSVRMVINTASGEVMQELDFDEWGETITDTNPGFQPFGYAGGLVDNDTKLIRFGARDYDPQAGAWTTKDPIGLAGGVNVYGYANQSPISSIDPEGFAACMVSFPNMPIDTGLGFRSTNIGGHAGIFTYDAKGATQYHEYGRYPTSQATGVGLPKDDGNVRRVGVPDLKIGKDKQPTPTSFEALKKALETKAGKGTGAELTCSATADEKKILDYVKKIAEDANRAKYNRNPFNSNQCRDFAARALSAGG